MTGAPAVEVRGLTRRYQALRPLRIAALEIAPGERVSIGGIDAGAGELIVNLLTGASLPDSGEVRVFGRSTTEITEGNEWLSWLERFGIVSARAVLLEDATLEQNLAMPYTLEIDPVPAEVAARVRDLAERCGIAVERWLSTRTAGLPADVRVRAHLARALALAPRLVLVEHPTAEVPHAARQLLAADIARACDVERITAIVLTNDDEFARVVATRNLKLDGATGALKPLRRGWFSRR